MRYSDGVDDEELYALLGVTMAATAVDLKQGRRIQAQTWHPDRNQDPAAQSRMAAINNAYRILSDPRRRQEYDASLKTKWKAGPEGKPGTSSGAKPWAPTNGHKPHPEPQAANPGPAPPDLPSTADFLRAQGFKVVDNRHSGGGLWVVSAPGLEAALDVLRHRGIKFEYSSSGGMATGQKPAWFTRDRS